MNPSEHEKSPRTTPTHVWTEVFSPPGADQFSNVTFVMSASYREHGHFIPPRPPPAELWSPPELNPGPVRLVRDIETGRASEWFLDRAGWRGFSRDKHLFFNGHTVSLTASHGAFTSSITLAASGAPPPPHLPAPPAAKRKLIAVSVHSFLFKPLTSIKNRPSVILGTQPTNHYIASRHQMVSSKMPNSRRSFMWLFEKNAASKISWKKWTQGDSC